MVADYTFEVEESGPSVLQRMVWRCLAPSHCLTSAGLSLLIGPLATNGSGIQQCIQKNESQNVFWKIAAIYSQRVNRLMRLGWIHGSRISSQWRHSGRDDVPNHQTHHCLLNHLSSRRSKKTSKFRVTGLCSGNSPVTGEFFTQRASNAENVSIWWRHMLWHGTDWFPSGSPHWYSGDHKIVHVPVKQYWWIWANIYESRGSNMNRLYNHSYKHNGTVRIFIINPFTWTGGKISSFHKWRHMIFMASHNRNISIDFSTAKSGRLRGNIKVPHY